MPTNASIAGAVTAKLGDVKSLNTDNDAFEADQRQQEILLDHAMDKSSNVHTPEEEEVPSSQTISNSSTPAQLREPPAIQDVVKPKPEPLPPLPFEKTTTTKKKRVVVDVEDDFFSMSFVPPVPDLKKKKKKKVKKADTNSLTRSNSVATIDSAASKESSVTPISPSRPKNQIPSDADVVDLLDDDEDGSPQHKKPRRRLTPPPFDEAVFTNMIREQVRAKAPKLNHEYDPDFDDCDQLEFAQKLKRMQTMASNMNVPQPVSRTTTTSFSSLEDNSSKEPRTYELHVTSFLPGSANTAMDLTIKGHKKFGSVLNKILKYLLNSQVDAQVYADYYNPERVQLLWNEIRVTNYTRPDTLNINRPLDDSPTVLELGLYTKDQVMRIEHEKALQKERKRLEAAREEELDRLARSQAIAAAATEDNGDDEAFREIDKEIAEHDAARAVSTQAVTRSAAPVPAEAEPEGDDEDEEGYFKIGLKGVDNKKIIVRVNAETAMSKLVKYYLQQKGLPADSKVRLSFDDEDIPLDQTVGDTELEEDFTVEVYLI